MESGVLQSTVRSVSGRAGTAADVLLEPERWRRFPRSRLLTLLTRLQRWRLWGRLRPGFGLGLGLHALVTDYLRRLTAEWLEQLPAPKNEPFCEPIFLAGFFFAPTGLGRGVRLAAQAFAAAGTDVRLVDLTQLQKGDRPQRLAPREIERGPGTLLLHFNPDMLGLALSLIGPARLRRKRVIAYWAWELPEIPNDWVEALTLVDEVWTPTQFVAKAVRTRTQKPVRVVPHPVAGAPPGMKARAAFGLKEGVFTVLSMFSFSSSIERKNPIAAVRAFRSAIGEDTNALLLIKVGDSRLFPEAAARLEREIGPAKNIRVLEVEMDEEQTSSLIASADVVLSLHRSEGFGLVMAEAMLNGVPVIATKWSGNLDFMDEDCAALVSPSMVPVAAADHFQNSQDQMWADPDIEEAAQWLRKLYDDPVLRQNLAARGKAAAITRLSARGFAETALGGLRRSH